MKPSIVRIERLNYLLGGTLTAAAAITQSRSVAIGVAVGAALTCANFFVLRRLVVRWTKDGRSGSSKAPYVVLPKMIGLMGAVVVAILVLSIDPLAFAIGYSVFIPSIAIEAIYSTVRPEGPTTEKRDG